MGPRPAHSGKVAGCASGSDGGGSPNARPRWPPDASSPGSCASSVSTEPIEPPEPGAVDAIYGSSSPIAANKLYYRPIHPSDGSGRHGDDRGRRGDGSGRSIFQQSKGDDAEDTPAAMLYLHGSSNGMSVGHELRYGVNTVCGNSAPGETAAAAVAVLVDEDVNAVIEISDGLHSVYDCGSPCGVFMGHRRAPLQHGVRYEVSDGKMLWFGATPYWYRILSDGQSPSPSPPPPWRADSRPSTAAPVSLANNLMRREVAGGAEVQPAAACLRREIAGMAISPVPPGITVPPIILPAATDADSDMRGDGSFPGSPNDGIFGFSPALARSPPYASDDDDGDDSGIRDAAGSSALVDTEPMSPIASSPRLLISASPTPPPGRPTGSGMDDGLLRVDESLCHPDDGYGQLSPTQPLSPARLPPRDVANAAGSAQRQTSPETAGATQPQSHMILHEPQEDEPLQLPPAAAFVYAPQRVVLLGNFAAGPERIPRYPYDGDGMESLLGAAVQPTPPTQLDSETFCATAETALSSDFSQAFLSPLPPPPPPPPPPAPLPLRLPAKSPGQSDDAGERSRLPFRRRRSREAVDNFSSDSDSDTSGPAAAKRPPKVGPPPQRASSGTRSQSSHGASTGVQKFAMPLSMSSRHRPLRHAPLVLQPSSQVHSPGALASGIATPTVRRGTRSAERSSLLLAPTSSNSSRASPTAVTRTDEFPDDFPIFTMPYTAQSAPRTSRPRWPPLGTSPVFTPLTTDRTPLSATLVAATAATSTRRHGSLSPAADTPTRLGLQSARLPLPPTIPQRDAHGNDDADDERLPNSSPVLPQPSLLLKPQSGTGPGETSCGDSAPQQQQQQQQRACDSQTDRLFDPSVDPPSSPPDTPNYLRTPTNPPGPTTPATAPTPRSRTSLRPSSDEDSDEIKPRIITRGMGRTATYRKPRLSAGAVAMVVGDANGWINMDAVRTSNCSTSHTRPPSVTKCESGESSASRHATPLSASRTKSLRESLRKLPGNRGMVRTGLSSRRGSARRVLQHPSPSQLPKPLPQRAATDTPASVDLSPTLQKVAHSAPGSGCNDTPPVTALESDTDGKERISGILADAAVGGAKRPKRSSHRALDLNQHSRTRSAAEILPRMTRQRSSNNGSSSNSNSTTISVTISGFQGVEKDRIVLQLEARGFSVVENPLLACACVRYGRLGRTLKVLCALARGNPVVTSTFATRSGAVDALATDHAHDYLLVDHGTECEWGMTLVDTLNRARELSKAEPLLSMFCVYIADDVVQPSPASLAVMVRAAGGAVLNDLERQEMQILNGGALPSARLYPGTPHMTGAASADLAQNDHDQYFGELSQSSTEPDDDSDEDWCMDQRQHPPTRKLSAASNTRQRRKALPKLTVPQAAGPVDDVIVSEPVDDGIMSEPSLVLGLPSTASRSSSNSPTAAQSKRRRVDEQSPGVTATTVLADTPTVPFLDPKSCRSDLQLVLSARKAELRLPARSKLLVVSADTCPARQKLWKKHQAMVVDPEQIIQSIVRCSLQF